MAHPPTPEEADHVLFFFRWWKEVFLGAAAFFSAVAFLKKGQKVVVTVSPPVTATDMALCRSELKAEIHAELHDSLDAHKKDMLRQIKLMIDAAHSD